MKTNFENIKPNKRMNNGLHKLFLEELRDIYDAEHQLVKALPKMAKAVQSEELRNAIESHLEETEKQVTRLESVFESLEETPKRKKCKAIQGLIAEAEEMLSEHEGSEELDAAVICAAQKTEHYEIATYGCLCSWAEQMGHRKALKLLKETLAEEKAADEALTEIAQSEANVEAER